MKIAHLCLSCFYIDGASYQENSLVAEHVLQGHDVLVLASTENYDSDGKLTYLQPKEYIGGDGALVKRIPYRRWLPHKLAKKLRVHPNIYKELASFAPDVILFHGACGWELRTVTEYVGANPRVKFFVDSHEDFNNSAKTFLSRELLHKVYYRYILNSSLAHIEKILCISIESMDFVEKVYKVDRDMLEFYPLGGNPISDTDYEALRLSKRDELGVDVNHLVFVQSGKFTPKKKLVDTLMAFSSIEDPDFRLFVVGVLMDDVAVQAKELIAADERIIFLGWCDSNELNGILSAADIYLQPGTQSVTMQQSMCLRCALVIDDVKSHQPFVNGNGWLLNDKLSLQKVLGQIKESREKLAKMKSTSYKIALELLDYKKLAERIAIEPK